MNEFKKAAEFYTSMPFMGRSVCLVATELASLDRNGGIGTYCFEMAKVLAGDGATVEILYVGSEKGDAAFDNAAHMLARYGIRFTRLDDRFEHLARPAQSYRVMQHLQEQRPDTVIFSDNGAAGYYSLIAKKTGCEQLSAVTMCVVAHGSTEWANASNEVALRTNDAVLTYEMERRSVELADVLVAPSKYIVEYYEECGWSLPENTIVLPNTILFGALRDRNALPASGDNITFFGRLETRKGLWAFCAALDRLRGELAGKTVTFLGRPVEENGLSTDRAIMQRAAGWPCHVRLLTTYDTKRALAFLRRSDQVAVFPSDRDNSPSVILECLSQGIPFICSEGGGSAELVDKRDHGRVLFGRGAAPLADKLAQVFKHGCEPVGPSFDSQSAKQHYLKSLHTSLQTAAVNQRSRIGDMAEKTENFTHVILSSRMHGIEAAITSILKIRREIGGTAGVVVVSEDPEELASSTDRLGLDATILPADSSMADLAQLAETRQAVVAISSDSQILAASFFTRAAGCFAVDRGLGGLTGMATAHRHAGDANKDDRDDDARRIENYVYSTSSILLATSKHSNSGFILLAPGSLSELSSIEMMHRPSGKLKPVKDLVHEIVCGLMAGGLGIEPIPDMLVPTDSAKEHSPTFTLGETMRSTIRQIFRHAPGSPAEWLGRMAIEVVTGQLREEALAAYMSELQQSVQDQLPEGYRLGQGTLSEILVLANAAGHGDTANELLLSQALADLPPDADLDGYIRSTALTVSLFDRAKAGMDLHTSNLNHEWSFRFWDFERVIQLHPNNQFEGRASMAFHSLDLRKIKTFDCRVVLPDPAANPVRLRVDILSDDGLDPVTNECILGGGDNRVWSFEVPRPASGNGRLVLGVEMVDPSADTASAYVKWVDPMLRPAAYEGDSNE